MSFDAFIYANIWRISVLSLFHRHQIAEKTMRDKKIAVFYNPKQVLEKGTENQTSKSPLKPRLMFEQLQLRLSEHIDVENTFSPFSKQEFLIAHEETYVDAVLTGTGLGNKGGLGYWNEGVPEYVAFTNANLYNAIATSIREPEKVCLSLTSGFHHARPSGGAGFCTFSGQAIASVKLYRELGLSGAYLDLDGHFGNSIEDSRSFVSDLNKAVPLGFNINIGSNGARNDNYVAELKAKLDVLEKAILANQIHYVVWCHGADSHEWDDLGGGCSTLHWLECSNYFYEWVKKIDEKLGRPLPLSASLFGGYRSDDYASVLNLHLGDVACCINTLLDEQIKFEVEVKQRRSDHADKILVLSKRDQNKH